MTKDEILSMVREAGGKVWDGEDAAFNFSDLERFAALVAEKEREACALLIENIEARCVAKDVDDPPLKHVAAAIRERGQKEYRGARLVLTKDGVKQDGWMGDK